jgi:hypothetical protein
MFSPVTISSIRTIPSPLQSPTQEPGVAVTDGVAVVPSAGAMPSAPITMVKGK